MKKKIIYLLSLGLLGGLALTSTAQAQVTLKSIGVGVSYWKPSLDYWNDRSVLSTAGAKFKGQAMPTASVEIGLVKGLSLAGRVGYWKSSASGDITIAGTSRTEKLSLSVIPLSLDLKYSFPIPGKDATVLPSFVPYVGVGVSRYFIKNDFTRTVAAGTVDNSGSVSASQAGNTYGVQVFAGLEKKIVGKLYAGLDVRYHLGSYNQLVQGETTSTTEKVSINGLEAGLSLKVKFK